MDFTNLATLIFSFLTLSGTGKIYEGKTNENNSLSLKGIIYLSIGVLGNSVINPIFPSSFILSLLSATCFVGITLGLIAFKSLSAKPTILNVTAELMEKEDNNLKDKNSLKLESSIENEYKSNQNPFPLTLSCFKEKALSLINKK